MSGLPTISIIVVNWNGLHHLRDCLSSLFSLEYPNENLEWILVDNGSTDGSLDFVSTHHPDVRILRNSENQGFAKPNNNAAREAKGEYIALINNDMRAHPGWLTEAMKSIDEASGTLCVGSKILSWDGEKVDFNGGTLQFLGYAAQDDIGKPASESMDIAREILFPCGGSMLVRRDIFLELGGFDEDYFAIYEDVDFGWRLWLMGYRIRLAPHSRVFHKLHGTLERSREEKMRYLMHRNALYTIIKNYSEETLHKILPIAVVQAIRRAVFFSGMDRSSFYLWAGQDAQVGDPLDPPDSVLWQCRDAMNHLVMLDDVFEALPQLREKRAQVQKMRKVPDDEILGLFGDPFRTIVEDPRYKCFEQDLLGHLSLVDLFTRQDTAHAGTSEGAPDDVAQLLGQIRHLEHQKKQLELQLMEASRSTDKELTLASPRISKGPRQLLKEFTRIMREDGLGPALRQSYRYFVQRRG